MKIQLIKSLSEEYNQKAHHPLQSWAWGEARKKMGIEVLRLGEFSVSNRHAYSLNNVYQLTFHKIPLTKFKIGYLPRSVLPSKEILEFLYDYGKKNKVIFIKIEPYVLKSEILNPKSQINSKFKILNSKPFEFRISNLFGASNLEFRVSDHPLFPEWTQILDLTQTEDQLLKNMHHKTRYNIKLAQKKGATVKEMTSDRGFDIFSKLYFETCKRQKYYGHNKKYHQIIWDNLKKNIAHILIAFYKETPLAAYELFHFKDVFYYPYGGTSLKHRNLMASNLLMWEAIKLGKKLGAVRFDFWGSLPPDYPQNHPWAGFTRFKQGYGSQFVQMIGGFDLVINPVLYQIYNVLHFWRQIYLQLKKTVQAQFTQKKLN